MTNNHTAAQANPKKGVPPCIHDKRIKGPVSSQKLTCQRREKGIPALFDNAKSPCEITCEHNPTGGTYNPRCWPSWLTGSKVRLPCCVTNSARTDRVTVGLFKAQKYVEHFYLSEGDLIRLLDR